MEYDWVHHNKKAVAEDRDRIDRKGQALLVRCVACVVVFALHKLLCVALCI